MGSRLPKGLAQLAVAMLAGLAALLLVLVGGSGSDAADSFNAHVLGALAVVIFPATALLAVLRPWAGLIAWVVTIPILNATRASVMVGDIQVISSTVIGPALAVGWYLESKRSGLVASRAERLGWWLVGAVVVLAAASTVAGGDVATSIPVALNGLVLPALLVPVVIGLTTSRQRVVVLLTAMGTSVVMASVYNLLRLVRDTTALSGAQALRPDLARFTYYNVGIFGDILAMTLPLVVALMLTWRRRPPFRRSWQLAAGALLLLVVASYLTFTKSAWLGCLAGTAVAMLVLASSWRGRATILVGTALIGLLIVPYPALILGSFSKPAAAAYQEVITTIQGADRAASWNPKTLEGEVSISERILATSAGLLMARDHPLLGVGPGRFATEYAGPYRSASTTRDLGSPHDLFVDLAAEFGLPTLALVAGAIVTALVVAAWTTTRDPLAGYLGAGLFGALSALCVVGVTFGIDLYRPWRYMDTDVLWAGLLVALALALWRVGSPATSPDAIPAPARIPG